MPDALLSPAGQEDLANTLLGACDVAQRYADEHWPSVPFALDAVSDVTVLLLQTPGPEAVHLRMAATAFCSLIHAVRLQHGAGGREPTQAALARLGAAALALATEWRGIADFAASAGQPLPRRVLH